jgi:endonuclease/exonuclease/phosphatase family metal-dependent hydrolase
MALQSGRKTLSVLSFNIFGAPFHAQRVFSTLFTTKIYKRFAAYAAIVNTMDVDIICMQEVNSYRQFYFLKKRLSQFPYVCYRRYIQGPKGGLVIFSKLPLTNTAYVTFKKSGVYWNKSFIAHLIRRGLLVAQVESMPVTIINTHLTHNIDHDWSSKAQIRSIHDAQLAQIIKNLSNKEHNERSIILTGDFNIPKSSTLFSDFLKNAKLIDVFHEHTSSTYHEEFTFKNVPLGRIDHIFLFPNGKEITVDEKKHMFEEKIETTAGEKLYLSDHIGLYARFRI